ncbi:toprim domain-containing protein [Candidatus Woesearchaeota archaeon]|nr:toprim domain-containing protein [Candidatus Woesearchaeota archaeon]
MRGYDVSEELAALLSNLAESKAAIIVEGSKDKAALEKAGIGSRIFVLSSRPLFAVAEEVAANYSKAAILTDLDAEGRKLYGKLNTLLQQLGVKVDDNVRNFLFKSTKLRQIEGIANIIPQR